MRTPFLTEASIHPKFLPFLGVIDATADAQGPRAGISLATETLEAVAKHIEFMCADEANEEAMLAETGVGFADFVQLAEVLGDRIEALCNQIQ